MTMYLVKKRPFKLLAILTFTLSAWSAHAQNSVIPYQGTLFSQGKPVSQTEPIRMAFAIYSDNVGLEAGQESSAPGGEARKWTSWDAAAQGGDAVDDLSETVGVQVRNGRFLVHLGETEAGQQPLGDDVFDASELYVIAWVMQDPENPNTVFRLPPQRLQTVPHAVTAKRAVNFEVKGTLKAEHLVISSSPTVCDQSRRGEVRYSAAHNALEYCDGSSWDRHNRVLSIRGFTDIGGSSITSTLLVMANTLLDSSPQSPVITIPATGIYDISVNAKVCAEGVRPSNNAIIKSNIYKDGVRVPEPGSWNAIGVDSRLCASSMSRTILRLQAGSTLEGQCTTSNQSVRTICEVIILKL